MSVWLKSANLAKQSLLIKGKPLKILSRNFRLSSVCYLKEIKISKSNGNTITIEGVKTSSPRTDHLMSPPASSPHNCCPLCTLNLRRLCYTDVLILGQFVESNGHVMAQEYTGLCHRQYNKVRRLVAQAQRCKLMDRPTDDDQVYGPWDQMNAYLEFPERLRDQPMTLIRQEYWK